MAEAANLSSQVAQLDKDRLAAEAGLNLLQIKTGVIQVAPGVTKTATQMKNETEEMAQSHKTALDESTKLYQSIQNLTNAVRNSNQTLSNLLTQVSQAMKITAETEKKRVTAELTVNGTLRAEIQNSTVRLQSLNKTVKAFEPRLTAINKTVLSTWEKARKTNETVFNAESLAKNRSVEMANMVKVGQSTKLNATEAQTAANISQSAVNVYKVSCECDWLAQSSADHMTIHV